MNPISSSTSLCSVCRQFDIRALLLASSAIPVSEDVTVWQRLHSASIEAQPQLFFKHQPNLNVLREASASCPLCSAIWIMYSIKTKRVENGQRFSTSQDISLEPIWITCTPANNLWQKFAQVIVFRKGKDDSTSVLASFDPFVNRDSPPLDNAQVLLRSIFPYSGSDECLTLARQWLETCLRDHKDCRPEQHISRLPTRVLDVGVDNGFGGSVRVIDSNGQYDPFVALSYCWGGESALTLTANTEQMLRQGIAVDEFPATLRDAILVTRSLHYRYLWIDALCIRQDSAEDWAAEAVNMRDIYRGAVVTIAASAASKTSEGMFRNRTPPVAICQLEWQTELHPKVHVYLRPAVEVMDTELRNSFINTRGWTLQESLLAPRTIWFGQEQLVFECGSGQVNEAGHTTQSTEYYRSKDMMRQMTLSPFRARLSGALRFLGIPPVVHIPYYRSRPPKSPSRSLMLAHYQIFSQGSLQSLSGRNFTYYRHWREILTSYTERQLTKPEDIFPALSGLAEHFGKVMNDTYLAGLWKGNFIWCLNWSRQRPHKQHLNDHPSNLLRRDVYIAPSWSWASIIGSKVEFAPARGGTETSYKTENIAKIIEVSVETAGNDPYGKVETANLVLRAPFLGIRSPWNDTDTQPYPALAEYIHERLVSKLDWFAHMFNQQHNTHLGQEFGLIQTCTHTEVNIDRPGCDLQLLLVESTGEGTFRRLAWFPFQLSGRPTGDMSTEGLEKQEQRRIELVNAGWMKRTMKFV